jgi:hypothetical protein
VVVEIDLVVVEIVEIVEIDLVVAVVDIENYLLYVYKPL